MNSQPRHIDILQNLEAVVVEVWRNHRDMSDSVVTRAYEAAFERYRAEVRGHQVKPCTLTGLDREVFDAVITRCEIRLGRAELSTPPENLVPGVPVDEMLECLRELRKSVERHSRTGGRQGYLTFVNRFLP